MLSSAKHHFSLRQSGTLLDYGPSFFALRAKNEGQKNRKYQSERRLMPHLKRRRRKSYPLIPTIRVFSRQRSYAVHQGSVKITGFLIDNPQTTLLSCKEPLA